MRETVIRPFARFVTRNPGLVLTVGILLAAVSVKISAGLETRPSRLDMVPRNDPAVVAWREFNEDFGGLNTVLVVVEGPVEVSRRFVDEAAAALEPLHDWVRTVTYKADVARLEAQGLYLLDTRRLADLERDLVDLTPFVREIAATPTATRLVEYLADEVGDEEAPTAETPKAIRAMELVENVVLAIDRSLEAGAKPPAVFPSLAIKAAKGKELGRDAQGYILSKSGARLLMAITPAQELRDAARTIQFMAEVKPRLQAIEAKHPGVTFVTTGGPIRSMEEEETVKHDMRKTALVAGIAVVVLCRVYFQGILPGLLLSLWLWLSIIYNGALTKLLIGHINLIGAVFIPLLLGLGEDFGNYLLMTYQDSGKAETPETMEDAIVVSLPGCFMGALTTAAVFYALRLHKFAAYQEMGIICGNGIMLAWLCMYTLMPAGVLLRARIPWLLNKPRGESYEERFSPLGRALVAIVRPRKLILAGSILAVLLVIDSPNRLHFDYNLTNLLSRDARSVEYEKVLQDEFGLSTEFAVASVTSMADVYRVYDALQGSGAVGVADSLAALIPRDVEAKRAVVSRISEWGASRGKVAATVPAQTAAALAEQLAKLKAALKRPRGLANMAENQDLHDVLNRIEKAIDGTRAKLEKTAPEQANAMFALMSQAIRAEIDRFTGFLASARAAQPYTFETLPASLKNRYVSKTNRLVTYISPRSDLSTRESALAFHDAMMAIEELNPPSARAVEPGHGRRPIEVAGIPIIIFRTMEMVRAGFGTAATGAMVICFLMVLLDFRRLDLAFLCMLPVAMGAAWMCGLMQLFRIPWNPLDSIAIPILPGCGVAFGVNIIHRMLLERDMRVTLASTGRAAFYSAFTTCVGFAALLAAHHRGLASFGLVMVIGDAACVVACLLVLPILLSYRVPEGGAAETKPSPSDAPTPGSPA